MKFELSRQSLEKSFNNKCHFFERERERESGHHFVYYQIVYYIMHRQYTTYIKQAAIITIRLYLAACFGRDWPSSSQLRTTIKVQ